MEEEHKTNNGNNFVGMHGENIGLGFVARDSFAKQQELSNKIQFKIIKNDATQQNMKWLIDLKNIFARQLPKMPKEYIVKLVFDRYHQSMIILKDGVKVVGGICFREFKQQKFAQVAFLAITSTQQIRGFGTRLMNKLKEQMQKRKVQYLVTYADNLALGYFRKQGFSKQPLMPIDRTRGRIKDYQGGTLMQCHIHPFINYSMISTIIKDQKAYVVKKVIQLAMNHIVFSGAKLNQKVTYELFVRRNSHGDEEFFRLNPMLIDGVEQSGWTWSQHDELMRTKEVSFLLQCKNIIDMLNKHQSSWPFRQPVSLEDVPDYHIVIKEPIDIKTIDKKLSSGECTDRQQFCALIELIFQNCKKYNQLETIYYKCGLELEEYITPHLNKMRIAAAEQQSKNKRKNGQKKIRMLEKQ